MDPFIGAIVFSLLAIVVYYRGATRKLTLPPGPPGELISGSIKQLIHRRPWLVYAKWAETYGPIISYRAYHKRVVVLNSAKVALDLLESKAGIYSDRPIIWMGQQLTGRGNAVFNISALNPRHRKYRRQLHSGLNSRATQTYLPLISQETSTFLKGLATTPENFVPHLRRNAAATILKITYGWTVADNDDELVKIITEGIEMSTAAHKPGRWFVETIPWLRFVPSWFPGAEFKRIAADYKEGMSRIDMTPFKWTKEQIKSGNYIESFTSMGLQGDHGKASTQEQEDILKWCAAALYVGGADTTVVALSNFFLRMSLHPDVQQRAQAEIDQLLNMARLPTIDDQKDLPYTVAVIKEVLRHTPVAPLGLPHRVTQDDVYQGYFIPKGTTVLANIWAITNDNEMYPNPSVFDPERFLARPGFEPQTDPRKWVFGFGRRVCPGAHFAETSFFLNVVSILATFNIAKALDTNGREIEPEIDYNVAIASHPKPFKCRITPRSPELLTSLGIGVA